MSQRRLPSLFLLAGALLAGLSGCALATKGFDQKINVTSTPVGATVLVNGKERGTTPVAVSLSRKNAHRVELRKPGFAPATAVLRPRPNEFSHRTLRFGIDVDSGAVNDLTPSAVALELVPQMLAAPAAGDAFERLTAAVIEADGLRQAGVVTGQEHGYMMDRILAHYAR